MIREINPCSLLKYSVSEEYVLTSKCYLAYYSCTISDFSSYNSAWKAAYPTRDLGRCPLGPKEDGRRKNLEERFEKMEGQRPIKED